MSGKVYIGSSKNIYKRWKEHRNSLQGNYHNNHHLQNSYNKHGINAFAFEIVEVVKIESDLLDLEQHYLDDYKPEFNLSPTAGSSRGYRWTDKQRVACSERNSGKNNPMYGKRGKEAPGFGKVGRANPMYGVRGKDHHGYGKKMTDKQLRSQSGENSSTAELTWSKVDCIRDKYENQGYTQQKLADEYGVDRANIGYVVRYDTWKLKYRPEEK